MRTLIISISLIFSLSVFAQTDSLYFLDGHENDVTSVAYSPNGKYIASGDWAGQVNLYVLDSIPYLYLNFADHAGPVNSVAFSRDSKKLLTGGQDGMVHLYSIDDSTGMIMRDTSFYFTKGQINQVYYGPGLRMIFACDDRNNFFAYDLVKKISRDVKCEGPVNAFAVSIDRMSYYIATKGSTEIVQYDIMGKEKRRFKGHAGEVTELAVTIDRKFLISASDDKTVKVWNLLNGKEERSFGEHSWTITGLVVDPYSTYVASCGLDGKIEIHEIASGKLVKSFDNSIGRCTGLSLSTDLSHVIVSLQLKSKPEDEFGYGLNIWATGLKPPMPPTLKSLKNRTR